MYREYLADRGYDVTTATDGEQAVVLALKDHFDIAIVDIAMPKLDGLGLTMVLRSYTRTKRLAIISLSARTGVLARAAAVGAGADLALEKPCPPDELEVTIQAFLPRRCNARPSGLSQPCPWLSGPTSTGSERLSARPAGSSSPPARSAAAPGSSRSLSAR